MTAVDTALHLAAANPAARLPCPLCATSLKAENLERHLTKVHPGASASRAWRGKGFLGVFPCSLAFDGDALVLHHTFGLFRRVVALPCAIEVGAIITSRPDPILQEHGPAVTERTGSYLRLVGAKAITIGCTSNTLFAEHWAQAGWKRGERRKRCDVTVPREAMVAIEYALAQRGMLALAA